MIILFFLAGLAFFIHLFLSWSVADTVGDLLLPQFSSFLYVSVFFFFFYFTHSGVFIICFSAVGGFVQQLHLFLSDAESL